MNSWMILLFLSGAAAPSEDLSTPAITNVPGAEYPRVQPDLRLTFRLKAPGARRVQLQPGGDDNGLGKGPFEMERGGDGFWSVTTPPAVPGFHYYWLLVDGIPVNDPSSETFFGWGRQTSGVEVPERGVDFYQAREVPHGEVRARWYHARTTGSFRRAMVYTPPGYDADPAARYPVLYLQHGMGEDERAWVQQGRLSFILDNLLAAGKVRPLIVVCENGTVPRPRSTGAAPGPAPRLDHRGFEELLLGDLIPMIDATYRTLAGREHRALAGLSMGARQALQIGLNHPERFSHVGAFSPPPLSDFDPKTSYGGAFAEAESFNVRFRLLWLGAGSGEERFAAGVKTMHQALEKAGIRHVAFEAQGTAHEWQTWRKSLQDFAPRLFRESKPQ